MFASHLSEVKATKSYQINPINTRDLAARFLRPFPRMALRVIPERDFKSHLVSLDDGQAVVAQGYSFEVHGISDLLVRGCEGLAAVELLVNDFPIARAENPDGGDQVSIPTVGEGDCLLVSPANLTYAFLSLRGIPRESQETPEQLMISFVPWFLNMNLVGSHLNLVGFDYYSQVGLWDFGIGSPRPSHIFYAGGFMARKEGEVPINPRTLRESAAVYPKVAEDRKLLHISNPNSTTSVVELLPPEWVLEKDDKAGWDHQIVSVRLDDVDKAVARCQELGARVSVSEETYWTEAQRKEMLELSNVATDLKYAMYCKIVGIEGGPSHLDPPGICVSLMEEGSSDSE